MLDFLKENIPWTFSGIGTAILKKVVGQSQPPIVINNYYNIKKIENLIINQGNEEELREQYKKIHDWLHKKGLREYVQDVGKDTAAPVINYLNRLKKTNQSSVAEILDFFAKIKNGFLNWTIREKINGEKVVDILETVNKIIGPVEDKLFHEKVKAKVVEENVDLKEIEDNNYEDLNIGGIVGFLKTNAQFSNREIVTPDFVGFKRVKNKKALVNLAINKKLSIEKVALKSDSDWDHYLVEITIKNISNETIDFIIPKGQIFENKDFEEHHQNLASIDENLFSLEPDEDDTYYIHSLCLNEKIPAPTYEGLEGNITIFEVGDKSFSNKKDKQEALWKTIRKNKNKLQFAKW